MKKEPQEDRVDDEDGNTPSVTQLYCIAEPKEETVQTPSKIFKTKFKMYEGKMSKKSHDQDVCKKEGKLQLQSIRGPALKTFPCDYCTEVSCFRPFFLKKGREVETFISRSDKSCFLS